MPASGQTSNYVDGEKLPKGWFKIPVKKPKDGSASSLPDVVYTCEKLLLAEWELPSPKDVKAKMSAPDAERPKGGSDSNLPHMVHPQPPGLPRFCQLVVAVPKGGSSFGTLAYLDQRTGKMSTLRPRAGGEAGGADADAGPAPPPRPPRHQPSDEVAAAMMAEGGEEDAEDVYTETVLNQVTESTQAMNSHPFVIGAINSVVLLHGKLPPGRAALVNKFVEQLEGGKVKVFAHRGELPAQFAGFMPAVIEACSHVVVVGTDELHHKDTRGQALTYLRHAKNLGKEIVVTKLEKGFDPGQGEFGIMVAEVENVYDTSSKSELKRLVSLLAKAQKANAKSMPDAKAARASAAKTRGVSPYVRRNDGSGSLTQTAMAIKTGKGMEIREDLADSIVILYSWGRKGSDGTYKNQEKVRELKRWLVGRGFKVWIDVDHMEDVDPEDWAEEVVCAITQCKLVICCVTNSFHVPSMPAHEAFLLAVDVKVPGESLFGIQLSETCDMRCGSYGLYMHQVKYYDMSVFWLDTDEGATKFEELVRDIKTLAAFRQVRGADGADGEEDESGEAIYGVLDYEDTKAMGAVPAAVKAAEGAIMLSYGWGKRVNRVFPRQREVQHLQDLLMRAGYRTWLDLDHMMGNMDMVMAGAIEKSAAVIACASDEYVHGVNAQKEWLYANQRKVPNKSLFLVSTCAQRYDPSPLFGTIGKKSTLKGTIGTNWLPHGLNDAIIDVAGACTGNPGAGKHKGLVELLMALDKAGVPRRQVRVHNEPSLKTLERSATKRGKKLKRPAPKEATAQRPMWFAGPQDRETIKKKMSEMSKPGDFLVRESKTDRGAYVVVLNDGEQIRERKIARDGGKFIIKHRGETVAFPSMDTLLSHMKKEAKQAATSVIASLDIKYDD